MRLLDKFTTRAANYLPEDTNLLFHTWYKQSYEGPVEERIVPTFQSYVERGYAGNAVVFSVILARAMLFSEATFKFEDLATKKLYGTPALSPLEKPWPNGTTGELLIRMEQDASLAGNSYIRNDGDRLVRLRPDWVSIVLNPMGEETERSRWDVAGYMHYIDGPGTEAEFYPVDEVAHWSPIPDPIAEYRGISWLTPVVREINSDIAMTDYKRRFMDNSATPNLLVKYQQQLTPDALNRVRETWNARYGGTDGLKTAVLDNGADVTVIGNSLQAMDFTTVQAAGENRIAVAGGVPGIVVGLKEGLSAATYSNYEQAMRRFADLTMRPLWRSACASLAPLIQVPDGSRLWFDVADVAALRQGEQERAKIAQLLAVTAHTLILAGYVPDTVTAALIADDMSMLKHTGAVPTALYPEGQVPTDSAKEVGKWKS